MYIFENVKTQFIQKDIFVKTGHIQLCSKKFLQRKKD